MLVHWPNGNVPIEVPFEAFKKLQECGVIRRFGVSNFTPSLLEEAIRIAPVFCNQVEYHPFLRQPELQRMAFEHELLLTAYAPLAQGGVGADEVLRDIGTKHGKSPEQVALRWLIEHDNVVAIPRSGDPSHIAENLQITDFALTEIDRSRIAELPDGRRLVDPEFAPAWER